MVPADLSARLQAGLPFVTPDGMALAASLGTALSGLWLTLESTLMIPAAPIGLPGPITGATVSPGSSTATINFGTLETVFIPPFLQYTPGVRSLVAAIGQGLQNAFQAVVSALAGTVPAPGGVITGGLTLLVGASTVFTSSSLAGVWSAALTPPLVPPMPGVSALLQGWAAAFSAAYWTWVGQTSLVGTPTLITVLL